MNLIKEVNKPEVKKTVVIYAGRFQPFHRGHHDAYQRLVSKFGESNVYIATSNDTSSEKSPFTFKEKKQIATQMFGVPSSRFVRVSNPYRPVEILGKFDGKTTAYIAAVGEKDADRLNGKYFKPYKNKSGYGYDEIGYTYPIPPEANPISGTQVRKGLGSGDKDKAKSFFLKAYPKFDKEIFKMITGKLNENFIKGYPSKEDVKKIQKKNDDIRSVATTDDSYVYDPIGEIINRIVDEEAFQHFLKEYLNEDDDAATMGLTHLGGGYYGKDKKGPATHKREDGNIRPLTPAEIDAEKKKQMAKGPSDAPANEPKPSQPGQPVNKGVTAQGKIDKKKEEPTNKKAGEEIPKPETPPEQKLSSGELKSGAEKRASGEEKELSGEELETKEKLDKVLSTMDEQSKKEVEDTNNPDSEVRKGMFNKVKDWWDKTKKTTVVGRFIEKKRQQYKNTGTAINNLMHGRRVGSIVDPESGNHFHYKQVQERDENGKYLYDEEPIYKKDKKGNVVKDKEGNPIQDKNWLGKPKTKKIPRLMDGIDEHTKHLAHESQHAEHEQKHALVHTGIEVGFLIAGVSMAGGIAAGAGTVGKTIAKDLGKHATLEILGVENPIVAGSGGLAAAHFTHHLLEGLYLKENSNEIDETKLFSNIVEATMEKMKTYKLSDKQLLKTLEKYQKEKPKKDLENLLKENLSETKQQSIQHFVEFATKRLKLKETPKINLVGGREFAEVKSSLGGFNPDTKEIYVATEGRLTADILRTLAHEMVHRKQDELGLVRNPMKDGADGSPIENQAHAVAGILMREYGRVNKQIYNEDVNVDVDKGDTILMGKFKNKKVQVKDIGKDQHGMPTINGKQATTFRKIDEMGSKDVHFSNIIRLYKDSKFKKRINAYLFGNPNVNKPNDVARALRNMGYDEITQMEKELNIKPNFDEQLAELYKDIEKYLLEVSALSGDDAQPDGSYLPKGATRKLDGNDGANKGDDWFYSGGYTQMDFPVADGIFGDEDESRLTVRYSARNLPRFDEAPTKFLKEGLLLEGGAYGHMSHPFDDMDLTFGDLKNIITKALNGDLGVVREKTDGQALAISWKNGRLIAARNKGHLQNSGASAMGIEDVASKFGGRGGLTDAYNFAMKDLSAAIASLSQKQREKIFGEGSKFMNIEVIWPTSVNVIPYGQALLVFHNCIEYDVKGVAIGKVDGAESVLAGMIKQVNADVQSKYTIQGPPITEIPKSDNLSSKQGKYLSKLSKLQSEFKLNDSDNVADYHQAWWEDFINKKSPVKVDKLTKEALVRRWAFGDKSFRLNTISNPKLQEWAMENDKVNVAKQQKDNIKPFEEIFLGVGADVLDFVGSVLTVHPDKAIRAIKNKFKSVASDVRSGGDKTKIQKLRQELKRLNSLGGIDRVVASEGIVFFYNGKTYKLTGTFAPLNQILGLFY